MADQQDYTYHKPDGGNDYYNGSSNDNYNSNDFGSWIAIVIAMVVFWPVGLFLLFRKLMGYSNGKNHNRRGTTGRHPYDIRQEQANRQQWTGQTAAGSQNNEWWSAPQQNKQGASDAAHSEKRNARQAARSDRRNARQAGGYTPPSHMNAKVNHFKTIPTGKGLIIGGGITAGVFGFSFMAALLDTGMYWNALTDEAAGLFTLLAFFGTGMVLLYAGLSRGRKGKRYRKYLSVIGNRDLISVRELAQKTGIREKKVRDDLQSMLDMGLFPQGYLDLSVDMLVLSEDVTFTQEEPKAEPAPAEEHKDDNAVLQEIRQVNDEIADEDMSRKIDRIAEITGKILDYQRKNPDKNNQLRSFLNYYLPTTLKILRAYAQLEAQGIEGQNISSAKVRIEGMMDQVVEGFEKQLDMLFQNDALDITTDVSVLEQMLKKDGLSGGQGMTLGG